MQKLLVANRGEIALRIMRTARDMGIETVAVFSEADRLAPHVRYADEAFLIGAPPSSASYLRRDKILEVATASGADAIHPGYGFLSENSDFARAVKEAGLCFVGPSPESIATMGDKLAAKRRVKEFGVPLVPGTDHPIEEVERARQTAAEIGFPILLKAAAGGGGKGMRVVERAEDFAEAFKRAAGESQEAFGKGALFMEKYLTTPRHIEFQILADAHGNCLHLFERECSIQRRHQKLVEEAPSVVLSPEQRAAMGCAAVQVARSCDYVGAGTVEFLVEGEGNFYFLEMNTRLQVEHPVTELIAGLDLVREQIRIARGERLCISQSDLSMRGHAIELRVCAEDPENQFLPDTGRLQVYKPPQGPGVRVDDGVEQGMAVSVYYDSMLAKLIAYGRDRTEALARMRRACEEYDIVGVKNTLAFGAAVMRNPHFINGDFNTNFIAEHFEPEALFTETEEEARLAAAFTAWFVGNHKPEHIPPPASMGFSNWRRNRT